MAANGSDNLQDSDAHQDGSHLAGIPSPPTAPAEERPCFKPSLIMCPSNVVHTWWTEVQRYFHRDFNVRMWSEGKGAAGDDAELANVTLDLDVFALKELHYRPRCA